MYHHHHHHNELCNFRAISPVSCVSFAFRWSCILHLFSWAAYICFFSPWDSYSSCSLVGGSFPFCLHSEASFVCSFWPHLHYCPDLLFLLSVFISSVLLLLILLLVVLGPPKRLPAFCRVILGKGGPSVASRPPSFLWHFLHILVKSYIGVTRSSKPRWLKQFTPRTGEDDGRTGQAVSCSWRSPLSRIFFSKINRKKEKHINGVKCNSFKFILTQ